MFGHEADMDQDAIATLSEMQLACLRLVAKLKKTEEIAYDLGIAPSTVNTHIERAVAKLRVANRFKAAERVMAWDLTRSRLNADNCALGAASPAAAREVAVKIHARGRAADGPSRPQAAPARPEKLPTEIQRLFDAEKSTAIPAASTIAMGRRRNDLTGPERLLAGVMALVLLCLAVAGLGAAIEQLSHWRASFAARR